MEVSRLTTKGQMTIPKRIRDAAGLRTGDVVGFEIEGAVIRFRKISLGEDGYLKGAADTVAEWARAEDEDAWREL
jgi:AbrB family looped-hinge helix DNA binding protein